MPQFLRFARPADLDVLLPVFWIGFNVAMFPASVLTARWGGLSVIAGAALLGSAGLQLAVMADGVATLIVAQTIAGAAWGAIMMSGVSAALALGTGGDQGRMVGALFSALALATIVRMGCVAGGLAADPAYADGLARTPPATWLIGAAVLLVLLGIAAKRRPAPIT